MDTINILQNARFGSFPANQENIVTPHIDVWSSVSGNENDSYTEIEMINAHPCILSQLFKRHNLECPRLDEYITHREEHLEDVKNPLFLCSIAARDSNPGRSHWTGP